ncbi:WD40 repeat domain-containing serine/threonine protein kinase [Streptosporangium sp. NBC_01756]|uniref:WD40 repeat domain-containing serine/threonine protein kinase n=1 Tax=Streptosporangium sp. NBC_01756 TaxID=2975950 RepID=UPI002DD84F9A|nr:WD40 repeat domain-containing serine/threonine protein kinase [Streptosporangium sp. NBC_01756]WSC88056.1 WD40 repeat domain-containing serine/threonine protein kinase [Streptosporangium sp. NBC_01756]
MSTGLIDGDPQRLGDYWLAGRLGAGGQGVVYEAYDAEGTRVAVKVLHGDAGTDPELRDRFGREAAAARRVASFCTAGVIDADLDGPRPYIVSEYVEGPSLRRAVADGRRFTGGDLHRLATAIATALTAIHDAGVIHRDLKPDNVLLGPDGPRVIDFGVARTVDMSLTATGMVAGTPTYMAPEVFMGRRADTPADVFAWGGIMVFAATGVDPFRAESLGGVMHRVLSVEPQLDMLPERLRPFIAASLAKEPQARPSAKELLLALVSGDNRLDTPRLLAAGSDAGARIRAASADPALGTLAEDAYAALGPAERDLAPEVFLRLVTVTDDGEPAVRRAQWAELLDGRHEDETAAIRRVVQVFAYLVAHDDREVWLSRPALPQAWPRLRLWGQANRDGLAVHRGILTAAWRWQSQGRRDGDLFQGDTLENAMHWAATGRRAITLSPVERDFLEAGAALTRLRARRGRLLSMTLAVLLVVALAAGALAVQQNRVAGARSVTIALQRDQAEARQLAATADSLRVAEPVKAMLLSVAAWRLAPVVEARASLAGSLAQRETTTFHDPATAIQTLRALSRDGRTLVSAGGGEARIWDVRTGRRVGGFKGIGDDLRGIALSPSGRTLAVVNGLQLTIWDVARGRPTGATLAVQGREAGGDTQVFFGQAENRVLVTQGEGLTVWNPLTGQKRFPPAAGLDFDTAADGRSLVVGTLDGDAAVFVLDGLDRTPLGDRCKACGPRVAYSPDGRTVAVSRGKTVRLHDVRTGTDLERPFTAGNGGKLRFSPDGRFLSATDDTSIKLWHVQDGRLLLTQQIDAFMPVTAFDPDGRTLRYLSEGSVTALDITALTRPVPLKGAGTRWARLSPDGRLLASRDSQASEVRLWDVRRRRLLAALTIGPKGADGYFAMAFSGDGGRLAVNTGGESSRLTIWDTATFRRLATVQTVREGQVPALAMNADGTAVASYVLYYDSTKAPGGEIHLWDVPGGRHRWSRPQDYVEELRFTPDGRAIGVAGGEQRLLDTATGRPFGEAYGSPTVGTPVEALAFSADGARSVTADQVGRISVWETGSRRPVGTPIRGGAGAGAELAYSPHGDVIAAGIDSRSVALWDVATARRLGQPIVTGTGDLQSLAFSADGSRLVTVDSAGILTEQPVDPEAVVLVVCERAGRTLSRDEWRAYLGDVPYRDVCPA